MNRAFDLRILFPTSFSDACFQAGRAIAQLADRCRISLTIVHVVARGGARQAVHRELDSFLGEADHYDHCRRVLIESDDPPAAIADFAAREPFDLILSPSSDRLGLHSVFMPSFRGRLLASSQVPLWTMGLSCRPARFRRAVRNVACLVDFDGTPGTWVPLVAAFVRRFDAHLHVLDVIPPVTEGTVTEVFDSNRPLMPDLSRDRMERLFAEMSDCRAEVAVGGRGGELRRMLERRDVDLVFVTKAQARRGVVLPRFARDLDGLPCPVVVLGGVPGAARWSFDDADAEADWRSLRELAAAG